MLACGWMSYLPFPRGARSVLFGRGSDGRQGQLWKESVKPSESFFGALKKHPVPVAEPGP